MATYPQIEAALLSALVNSSDLQNHIAGRIFRQVVPPKTAFPYVVFDYLGGEILYRSPRPELDVYYQFDYIDVTMAGAEAGSAIVQAVLNSITPSVAGWHVYDARSEGPVVMEQDQGIVFYVFGNRYRLRAERTEV